MTTYKEDQLVFLVPKTYEFIYFLEENNLTDANISHSYIGDVDDFDDELPYEVCIIVKETRIKHTYWINGEDIVPYIDNKKKGGYKDDIQRRR